MNGRAKSVSTVRAETHGDTGARKSQLTDLHLANHEIKVTMKISTINWVTTKIAVTSLK